jgi:hypothetical protein
MVWLHARSWRAHCHFVLNSTKREAIKKEMAQTSYGGNGKIHPLVRLEARKIEGEHCALRKGSFEGQAMVTIYFFVGTYVGSPSRKPAFLETNCFRENRLLVYTVRTGYGPTKARCRGTLDASVSVVALLSEQRR